MFEKNRFERFHLGRKNERENDLRQELKICHHCREKHVQGYQEGVNQWRTHEIDGNDCSNLVYLFACHCDSWYVGRTSSRAYQTAHP